MGWEFFQHTEETRCGMFEPELAAKRKVSIERDGLDTSKACHISVRGNTRSRGESVYAIQRFVATPRTRSLISSSACVSFDTFVTSGLRQLVDLSDRSLPDGGPCICVLACVHHIVPVFDLQDFLPVQPYLHKRLVFFGEPEAINFLILPYKVRTLDPEGEFLRGMPFDSHHGVVVHINPNFTFKQILVFPLG